MSSFSSRSCNNQSQWVQSKHNLKTFSVAACYCHNVSALWCAFTFICWKKDLHIFCPPSISWRNILWISQNHNFILFILHFRYSFLMTIPFPHHVFHSKSGCQLLYLALYFILDFILHQTIAQPLNSLDCVLQTLFFFYIYFILGLSRSKNKSEVLSQSSVKAQSDHTCPLAINCTMHSKEKS